MIEIIKNSFVFVVYSKNLFSRKRHMSGVRLMWNRGNPLPLAKKWNPFAKDIPWLTYASHPLFWYKGKFVLLI